MLRLSFAVSKPKEILSLGAGDQIISALMCHFAVSTSDEILNFGAGDQRGWVFSCLDCRFLVVVFLCLFNRANLHTHVTTDT